MFIDAITGRVSKSGEGQIKLVIETRQRTYKNWDRDAEENWESFGTEIVKEVNVTEEGLAAWNAMSDEERVLFKKKYL